MILGQLPDSGYDLSAIKVGEVAEFTCTITEAEHRTFTQLTGDFNAIHCDSAYAAQTQFGRPICHGLQLTAYFSTLSGMVIPGNGSLTLSQQVEFKKPVYPDERLTVRGTVTSVFEAAGIVELKTEILDNAGNLRVTGTKLVQAKEFVSQS